MVRCGSFILFHKQIYSFVVPRYLYRAVRAERHRRMPLLDFKSPERMLTKKAQLRNTGHNQGYGSAFISCGSGSCCFNKFGFGSSFAKLLRDFKNLNLLKHYKFDLTDPYQHRQLGICYNFKLCLFYFNKIKFFSISMHFSNVSDSDGSGFFRRSGSRL